MDKKIECIKKFWNERAEEYGDHWKATLGEKYLRKLEIKTMISLIKDFKPRTVLDIGCGNAYSTLVYANKFPNVNFVGIDYSDKMIEIANNNTLSNTRFYVGDVLILETLPDYKFNMIITQRCLQNLPDYEKQKEAINNLLSLKDYNGVLLLMECSKNGVAQLNKYRKLFFKKPLEGVEPWHNNFFCDKILIEDFNAKLIHFSSTYMFISKVVYKRLSIIGYFLAPIGKFGYDKIYAIS